MEKLERTSSSKVLVVGSGPAGVELATTLADRLKGTATVELISTGMTASAAYFGTYTILLIVLLCQSRSMNLILSYFVSFPRPKSWHPCFEWWSQPEMSYALSQGNWPCETGFSPRRQMFWL